VLFELFQKIKNFFERLHLLFNTLSLAIGRYFQTEGKRNGVKGILPFVIVVRFKVLEKLILSCNLMVMLKVIDHLSKIVGQTFEVHLSRSWTPSKMEM